MTGKWAMIGAAFMAVSALAGCKPEEPAPKNAEEQSELYDVSGVDKQFLMTFDDMAVRTATGRELRLSGLAYCETVLGRHKTATPAYNDSCRTLIGAKIAFVGAQENRLAKFETAIPMGNRDIRPYNVFDGVMLLRAVKHYHPENLYTITDVTDCATGARTPPMTSRSERLPPDQWLGEAERSAPPAARAAYGRVIEGRCVFD